MRKSPLNTTALKGGLVTDEPDLASHLIAPGQPGFTDPRVAPPSRPGPRPLSPEEIAARRVGGVFCDWEIRAAIESGQIVVDPLDARRIQSSSVDVTLGHRFYATDDDEWGTHRVINSFDPRTRDWYFGPVAARPHGEMLDVLHRSEPFVGVPLDALVLVLKPQQRVLAHTAEAIGIAWGGTSQMLAKSTTGRLGLAACLDAGWGDEGYVSPWTMELLNVNRRHALLLVVGMPIAQIVFYKMDRSEHPYTQAGHYQAPGTAVPGRLTPWDPQLMLPRTLSTDDLGKNDA